MIFNRQLEIFDLNKNWYSIDAMTRLFLNLEDDRFSRLGVRAKNNNGATFHSYSKNRRAPSLTRRLRACLLSVPKIPWGMRHEKHSIIILIYSTVKTPKIVCKHNSFDKPVMLWQFFCYLPEMYRFRGLHKKVFKLFQRFCKISPIIVQRFLQQKNDKRLHC